MRIISLLPSATEILFELGLGDEVVGVTFECDFPDAARGKRIVSTSALPAGLTPAEIDAVVKQRMAAGEDLYHLDRGAFADLDPTLVVTQDLCAVCAVDVSEVDDALQWLGCRAAVVTLDPSTLDEVLESVRTVGAATGTSERAAAIVASRRDQLAEIAAAVDGAPRPTHAGAGVDRSGVHGRPLGARPRHGRRRRAGARTTRREVGRRRVAGDRGVRRRGGRRRPVRLPLGRGQRVGAGLVADERLPAAAEVWAVDADALVVRPGTRVVDGVAVFSTILHPGRCGPPDTATARRIA